MERNLGRIVDALCPRHRGIDRWPAIPADCYPIAGIAKVCRRCTRTQKRLDEYTVQPFRDFSAELLDQAVAIHEAGHAVACLSAGMTIREVVITPNGGRGGKGPAGWVGWIRPDHVTPVK